MIPVVAALAALLAAQSSAAGRVTPNVGSTSDVAAPVPEIVVPWVYPRSGSSRLIEQNIVPREQDIFRIHTADPADVVEAYYRSRAKGEGNFSVVSAVNQRIVANGSTVVTIESDGKGTVITIVATEPERQPDPATPFPVRKTFRPPIS